MSNILSVRNLTKKYTSGNKELIVLNDVSFEVEAGESLAIVGPSGSGKTTLLGLCAGLDRASEGNIFLKENDLKLLTEDQRASVRNEFVGFIFQNFQLLPTLSAIENIMVPMELRGIKNAQSKAVELLSRVGLENRADHYPVQLSGGEQQRISLARAFANEPDILFADEPTGNLDADTGEKVEKLIFDLNKEKGTTLVLVTHDMELAEKTDRIIRLKAGQLVNQYQTAVAS
ncbi:MAG: ABC transporter ATP-binding protein [Bacteroidota bacterium]